MPGFSPGAFGNGNHAGKDYQGRQRHGWFGNGTSGTSGVQNVDDAAGAGGSVAKVLQAHATAVLRGAVAALPVGTRKTYEATLDRGGARELATALRIWALAPTGGAAFHGAYLHDITSPEIAARLLAVARGLTGANTSDANAKLAIDFAGIAQALGPDRLGGFASKAEGAATTLLETNAR